MIVPFALPFKTDLYIYIVEVCIFPCILLFVECILGFYFTAICSYANAPF